jgi:hypothetical protein
MNEWMKQRTKEKKKESDEGREINLKQRQERGGGSQP